VQGGMSMRRGVFSMHFIKDLSRAIGGLFMPYSSS
jgi:hypothetical protein